MKKLYTKMFITTFVMFFFLVLVNVVGASSGNIEYVSQKITKAYFYLNLGIRVGNARKDLKNGMATLNRDIKTLEESAMDEEEKNVLMFISFTRDEMVNVLREPYSDENGAMMLDFSESLLEGAELISRKHTYKKDAEEGMLDVVEHMEFLLERITKYYISHKAGFKDYNNVVQLESAIKEFEVDLKKVNDYHYPADLRDTTAKLNKFWPIAKRFYFGIEKGTLPVIVMASTDNLKKLLNKLIKYHLKTLKK